MVHREWLLLCHWQKLSYNRIKFDRIKFDDSYNIIIHSTCCMRKSPNCIVSEIGSTGNVEFLPCVYWRVVGFYISRLKRE
jgi:hypothetical protein